MSQVKYARIEQTHAQFLPINVNTPIEDVQTFIGDAELHTGTSGIFIHWEGDDQPEEVELGDYLVNVFGQVTVFSAEDFHDYFDPC